MNYFENPALNASKLKSILRSPYYLATYEQKETKAMQFGTWMHMALLEPDRYKKHAKVLPTVDRRTKAGKELYKEFEDSLELDDFIISSDENETIKSIVNSVMGEPDIANLFYDAQTEVECYWRDPKWDIDCKCKVDLITRHGDIVELKTTSANVYDDLALAREVEQRYYNLALSWYMRGYQLQKEYDVPKVPDPYFIFINNKDPYECRLFKVDDSIIFDGEQLTEEAVDLYLQCREEDHWPTIQTLRGTGLLKTVSKTLYDRRDNGQVRAD